MTTTSPPPPPPPPPMMTSCSCTPLSFPDAGRSDGGRDAGPDAARIAEAGTDAAPPEAGCSASGLGAPCPDGTCERGTCTAATAIALWDADAGVGVPAMLPIPVCEWPPPGADCPCGTTRGALSLGTATSRYTPAPDVCLQPCVYDPIATGGCPAGTTCDPFGTCQVACAEDAVCQLRAVDPDGDGRIAWVVDPTTLGACDAVTGRCARPGRPGAAIGDACSDDHDCAADAFCASGAMLGLGSCVGIGCAGCTSTCVSFERGAFCITCDQALAFGLPCSDAGVPDDAGIDDAGIADAGADDVGTDGG